VGSCEVAYAAGISGPASTKRAPPLLALPASRHVAVWLQASGASGQSHDDW